MLYGKDIAAGQVVCLTSGMEVVALHRGDSPNYLFVDLSISEKAGAGVYELQWTSGKKKVTISYALHERQALSKEREGLSPADVVYLLMPDRYLNGDKVNDNSPLTAEEAAYDKDYGRHGGDLAGIDKSLDYLQELGVTAIWPTPVTLDNEPTVSYHGYACADYYLIDPRFGTNLQYRDLVNKAGRAGIKFIQDIVPNHCGTAHWWMKDLPFKDWINTFSEYTRSNFAMSTHMDPYAAKADRDLCVKGWFDTSMADMTAVKQCCMNSDKHIFFYCCSMYHGAMSDTYIFSQADFVFGISMNHAVVLYIASSSYVYCVLVSSDDGPWKDSTVFFYDDFS